MILFYGCRNKRSEDITGHYFLEFQRKRKVCIIVVFVPLFTITFLLLLLRNFIHFRDIMDALSSIGDVVKATEFIGQSSGLLLTSEIFSYSEVSFTIFTMNVSCR